MTKFGHETTGQDWSRIQPTFPTYLHSSAQHLLKRSNKLLGLCSKVEDRSHHPSRGAEEEQSRILPTFQRRHQPYFQWGGNLGTKEMDTMETMHNTWINVVPFLRRVMQSDTHAQVALLASATVVEYTYHMGRRHMCVVSATNVHTSICEHIYQIYNQNLLRYRHWNTLVVPTVHTSGVDLQWALRIGSNSELLEELQWTLTGSPNGVHLWRSSILQSHHYWPIHWDHVICLCNGSTMHVYTLSCLRALSVRSFVASSGAPSASTSPNTRPSSTTGMADRAQGDKGAPVGIIPRLHRSLGSWLVLGEEVMTWDAEM